MSKVLYRAAVCALVGVGLCAALFREDVRSLDDAFIISEEASRVHEHPCTFQLNTNDTGRWECFVVKTRPFLCRWSPLSGYVQSLF